MTTATRSAWVPGAALRGWQDTARALTEGYQENWRRSADLFASNMRRGAQTDNLRQSVARVTESGGALLRARAAVNGEWLRAPFWITGAASPSDLQTRYFQLFEARRAFVQTLLDSALGWQQAMTVATEEAVETAREGLDASVQTARRVANDQRQVQQAAVDATRTAVETTRQITETVVEQTREAVEVGRETAEAVTEAAAQSTPALIVKGNITSKGEKIYHLPGQPEYDEVRAEATFTSEEEARAAGFRPVIVMERGPVRGNVNAKGEKIYHLPGQANYDRIETAMTFATEDEAREAGFRPAQR